MGQRVGMIIVVALAAASASAQDEMTPASLDSLQQAATDTMETAPADTVPALEPVPPPDFFDTGREGTTAVLMSPVFPGWGQLYTGGGWRAALAFGAQWYFWSNMLSNDRNGVRYRDHARTLPQGSARELWDVAADERFEVFRDFAWWSGGILLLVTVDAYVGAGLYNFDEEPIPVPDRFDDYFDPETPEPIGSVGVPPLVIARWGWRF
ncbi:hypothetical protein GF314_09635 [bacterium]|nr:hypothetical protein [bacterium]